MPSVRPNRVHVQVHFNPDNPTDFSSLGFEVWSSDGGDLTAQEVLDGISDVLIDIYPLSDEGDAEPFYDA